jgi:hypothetical protein
MIRFQDAGVLALVVLAAGCQASTTRPGFRPTPGATETQVHLEVPEATRVLADSLRADSIPVIRVEERDGLVESSWFQVPGYQPYRGRPLGPSVVLVRAWVDVGKAGHSVYSVETVYRVMADPSRPDRELEAPVAEDHPASIKVQAVVRRLLRRFGDPDDIKADSAAQAFRRAQLRTADTTAAVRPDTTRAIRDTTTAKRDTTAAQAR